MIENEEHFIGHCTKYNSIREKYYELISRLDPSFSSLNVNEKVRYILKANNENTAHIIGKFIAELFKNRTDFFTNIQ